MLTYDTDPFPPGSIGKVDGELLPRSIRRKIRVTITKLLKFRSFTKDFYPQVSFYLEAETQYTIQPTSKDTIYCSSLEASVLKQVIVEEREVLDVIMLYLYASAISYLDRALTTEYAVVGLDGLVALACYSKLTLQQLIRYQHRCYNRPLTSMSALLFYNNPYVRAVAKIFIDAQFTNETYIERRNKYSLIKEIERGENNDTNK